MTKISPRKCILVLGMHRSGTSALTRTIGYLGARLPKTTWYAAADNPKGFWESQPISWANDRLLQKLDSSWQDWRSLPFTKLTENLSADWREEIRDLLIAEFGNAPLFIIKDPRICRFPGLFLETLTKLDVPPHIVIPFRNPLEVAGSLAVRNGFSREKTLLLWLRHVLDAESATRHLPRAFLSYDRLLTDWQAAMKSVAQSAKLTWPNSFSDVSADVDAFLTPGLRHHRQAGADKTGSAGSWFGQAYSALLSLEQDPQDHRACQIMQRLQQAFEDACAGQDDQDTLLSENFIFHGAAGDSLLAPADSSVRVEAKPAYQAADSKTSKLAAIKAFPGKPIFCEDVREQTSFPVAVHKAPMLSPAGRDTCLLVGYAPDGKPTPALSSLVDRFALEGIDSYVCLAVNDITLPVDKSALQSAAAVFTRANGGYDFAAWASLLASYPILWQSSRLLFVNDSIIPIRSFSDMVSRLRAATADFVALTESYELSHHTQSFFFAFLNRGLQNPAVRQFWDDVRVETDKSKVVRKYEVRLLDHVCKAGGLQADILYSFEKLFPGVDLPEPIQCNPSHHLWERLLLSGFPFVKAELLHKNPARVFIGHWDATLQSLGYETGTVHAHLAEMNRTRGISTRSSPPFLRKSMRGLATLILGSSQVNEVRRWNRKRLEQRKMRRMKPDDGAPQSLKA